MPEQDRQKDRRRPTADDHERDEQNFNCSGVVLQSDPAQAGTG
jgi:hypothetical protein